MNREFIHSFMVPPRLYIIRILLGIIFLGLLFYGLFLSPPSQFPTNDLVIIPKGTSVRDAGKILNKPAADAIAKYLEIRPKSPSHSLFITKTGRPLLIRNIRTAIDRYFRIAGIKEAKVNDLRHTWVAHQLQSGVPLTMVSKLAGHKRLSTTERYLQFIPNHNGESKVKLEEL